MSALLRHLPNALSLGRLLAGPALVCLALARAQTAFSILLIAALASDVLDGWIARRFHLQSRLGAMLDSAADIATLLSAAAGIAAFHPDIWQEHALAIGSVLGAWIIECSLALIRYGRLSSFHTFASKAAGYALGFFVAALFAFEFIPWLFYTAVALSLISVGEELLLLWLLPEWRADVRGLWWVLRERSSHL